MSKQESIANILKNIKINEIEPFKENSPSILRIHRIHDYLHLNLEQVIEKYHLQDADFSVLETLRRDSDCCCLSPTELYHTMLFSSGGLTKVLCRVTSAGLVERIDNPKDKRSKLVKLTDKGKILIDQVLQELHRNEMEIMTVFSAEEQHQLNQLLEKFLSVWER